VRPQEVSIEHYTKKTNETSSKSVSATSSYKKLNVGFCHFPIIASNSYSFIDIEGKEKAKREGKNWKSGRKKGMKWEKNKIHNNKRISEYYGYAMN